jgi:pilus assembly protein CpaC
LRDLAIALAAAVLFMTGDAYAQDCVIQIAGNTHTAMVSVTIGKSQDVRIGSSFVTSWPAIRRLPTSIRPPITRCRFLARRSAPPRAQVYAEGKKLIGIFDVEVQYDITRFAARRLQARA